MSPRVGPFLAVALTASLTAVTAHRFSSRKTNNNAFLPRTGPTTTSISATRTSLTTTTTPGTSYLPHPQPSALDKQWPPEKIELFGALVSAVENDLKKKGQYIHYNGFAPSRIEPPTAGSLGVGSGEFYLAEGYGSMQKKTMRWPEGYAMHYILGYAVMPTEAFFTAILEEARKIRPSIFPNPDPATFELKKPPTFSPPTPFHIDGVPCEGYWSAYLPQKTTGALWNNPTDRDTFVKFLEQLQNPSYIGAAEDHDFQILTETQSEKTLQQKFYSLHRGSTIQGKYDTDTLVWSEKYARDILRKGVLPTKHFFNVVNKWWKQDNKMPEWMEGLVAPGEFSEESPFLLWEEGAEGVWTQEE